MKISLEKAFKLLKLSAGIITDDTICYPKLTDLEDLANDGFLGISWEDDDGQEFYIEFLKSHNQEVELVGSSLFLKDSESQENIQITLLKNWDAESEIIQSEAYEKALEVYFPIKE